MLESEHYETLIRKMGGDPDKLPDRLTSTYLEELCACAISREGGYTISYPAKSITWDGVIGDRHTVVENAKTFVKVSDEVFTADDLTGGSIGFKDGTTSSNGQLNSSTVTSSGSRVNIYDYGSSYLALSFSSATDSFEIGTYFVSGTFYGSQVYTTSLTTIAKDVDVEIPKKYMPKELTDEITKKSTKADPVFTGAFSQNRKANTTVGNKSHCEGYSNTANGAYAHAEGWGTKVSGEAAHAEGFYSIATGKYSHAEGASSEVTGYYAHGEGRGTLAKGLSSHVEGEYNIADDVTSTSTRGKYVHIVGNGTASNARSNAHTLDWDGNAWYAGIIEGTAMIVKSSTANSTKKFKITVDDTGTISATEVT